MTLYRQSWYFQKQNIIQKGQEIGINFLKNPYILKEENPDLLFMKETM